MSGSCPKAKSCRWSMNNTSPWLAAACAAALDALQRGVDDGGRRQRQRGGGLDGEGRRDKHRHAQQDFRSIDGDFKPIA